MVAIVKMSDIDRRIKSDFRELSFCGPCGSSFSMYNMIYICKLPIYFILYLYSYLCTIVILIYIFIFVYLPIYLFVRGETYGAFGHNSVQ